MTDKYIDLLQNDIHIIIIKKYIIHEKKSNADIPINNNDNINIIITIRSVTCDETTGII